MTGPVDRGRAGFRMAVASGLLLAVAFLPVPSALLVLGALVPLFAALDRAGDPRRGAEIGACFAVTFWAVHLGWLPRVALRVGEAWPWTAWLGQTALLGLLGAGTGAAFVLLRRRGVGVVPAAVIGWVGTEWLRGHLLGPLSFPWSGLALPLARLPVFIQPAAWGGETLVAAGVVTANAALAVVFAPGDRRSGRVRVGVLASFAVGVALWAGLGRARIGHLEDEVRERARAVVVQPSISLSDKRGTEGGQLAWTSLRWGLAQAAGPVQDEGTSLVIFPETHLPFAVASGDPGEPAPGDTGRPRPGEPGPWPDALLREIADWAEAHGAAVLVGAYRRDGRGTRNSLLHLGPGGLEGSYDKVALVPGVERGPGGLVPGTGAAPLGVEGDPGALICIESAWSSLARRQARAGAGWLLNVTNDAWLGEAGRRSAAFDQHPWHLVLRSVETGRGAIRVGNNGWTGSVDPFGRWRAALPPDRPGVAAVRVAALPTDPIFVAIGDLVGPLCLTLLLVGVAGSRGRPTR